jgi:molecular chaperone HtpG
MSIGMEQTLAAAGGAMSGIKASIILEINPNHPVVARLAEEFKEQGNSDMVKNYSELLYAQALIIEGYPPDNPADFAARLSDLMAKR